MRDRARLPALALAGAALATLAACRAPGGRAVATYDARTFFETIALSGASFSADESRLLFTSDASGVPNARWVPLAGGAQTALTRSTTHAVRALEWFPHDERILYACDRAGDERDHVYVLERDGSIVDLTPGDGLKARYLGWARDGSAFFVATNERDARWFDLYRYEVAEAGATSSRYERALVFANGDGYELSAVSPDGRWLALTRVRSNADSDVYAVDLTAPGAAPRHLTPHAGAVELGVAEFGPQSERLYVLSDEGSEFARLWACELATGARELVAEEDWDIVYARFSPDGRYRVLGVNADARDAVRVLDLETGAPVPMPDFERGDVSGVRFSRSGRHMAFYVDGDTSPGNLHVMDMETGAHRQLTRSLDEAVDEADLVGARVVRFASFDGLAIPALVYRPHAATERRPAPALVWVGRGPGGQSRRGYHDVIQFLVNHGYAVMAVNNRGSSGYGKTFEHLDDRRHGEVDLDDSVAAAGWLRARDWVDGERVAILGEGYGGYLALAALAFRPDAFGAGIDVFGATDWPRLLAGIPAWWAYFRDALYAEMGDPEQDAERLRRISPRFHAERIRKPLLVVQGANDPRVRAADAEDLVAAVRAAGTPVEYLLFPDEGHGLRSKENEIAAAEAYLRFLDEHLR